MPQILDARKAVDQTVEIFDSFYSFNLIVGAAQYDIVHGYFVSVCPTRQVADNFTAVLFRIAQSTGIDVLELLDQIRGLKKLEMNQVICYYLNSFKSKTSLYGVSITPKSNQFAARNIVQ